MNNKVVIIGCGNVGTSYAYALLNQKTYVNELVLIDINQDKAIGEAMDLNHCISLTPSKIDIKVGNYKDVKDAKIVCITAGLNQKPGETRLDLINKNKKIIEDIVDNVLKHDFHGIFLIATNPVDIITKIVYEKSKFKPSKVIGSGTSLDTARLRYLLNEKLKINPQNVHAYVIGEHGDSEFVPWSIATIGLNPIKNFLTENELNDIYLKVRNSAYKIIEKKGFTNFGIGVCLVRITNAILQDENSIITISCYDKENDLYISQPAILNKDGVKEVLKLNLTDKEQDLLKNSINILKDEK